MSVYGNNQLKIEKLRARGNERINKLESEGITVAPELRDTINSFRRKRYTAKDINVLSDLTKVSNLKIRSTSQVLNIDSYKTDRYAAVPIKNFGIVLPKSKSPTPKNIAVKAAQMVLAGQQMMRRPQVDDNGKPILKKDGSPKIHETGLKAGMDFTIVLASVEDKYGIKIYSGELERDDQNNPLSDKALLTATIDPKAIGKINDPIILDEIVKGLTQQVLRNPQFTKELMDDKHLKSAEKASKTLVGGMKGLLPDQIDKMENYLAHSTLWAKLSALAYDSEQVIETARQISTMDTTTDDGRKRVADFFKLLDLDYIDSTDIDQFISGKKTYDTIVQEQDELDNAPDDKARKVIVLQRRKAEAEQARAERINH